MYADDLIIFAGLQKLLRTCSHYCQEYGIMYNALKFGIIINTFLKKQDEKLVLPDFSSSGAVLEVSASDKYQGHYITDGLTDDPDICRQCCLMYTEANI